jgi:hypothetical protein
MIFMIKLFFWCGLLGHSPLDLLPEDSSKECNIYQVYAPCPSQPERSVAPTSGDSNG